MTKATRCMPGMTRGPKRPEEAAGTGMWGSVLTDGISREVSGEDIIVSTNTPQTFCSPERTLSSRGFNYRGAAIATSKYIVE